MYVSRGPNNQKAVKLEIHEEMDDCSLLGIYSNLLTGAVPAAYPDASQFPIRLEYTAPLCSSLHKQPLSYFNPAGCLVPRFWLIFIVYFMYDSHPLCSQTPEVIPCD